MTGNSLLAEWRMRLNDEGDDTQLSDGTPDPQYFWSTTEGLYYLNGAQMRITLALINLNKANELKNLVSSTTSTSVPADCFCPFSAFVDTYSAVLYDDPRQVSRIYNSQANTLLVLGNTINRCGGAAHVLWYYKRPTAIVADGTTLTEMSEAFYTSVIDLAEYEATHKDNSQERIVMRREYGKEDIQIKGVQKFLANIA